MAVLYITEYATAASDQGRALPIAYGPPVAEQTVAIGAADQSNPFNENTKIIRVHCDLACFILIGTNPTADSDSMKMAANQTEYFGVPPGYILSVVAA